MASSLSHAHTQTSRGKKLKHKSTRKASLTRLALFLTYTHTHTHTHSLTRSTVSSGRRPFCYRLAHNNKLFLFFFAAGCVGVFLPSTLLVLCVVCVVFFFLHLLSLGFLLKPRLSPPLSQHSGRVGERRERREGG